jgi:small-conductance mechanosensitive channel
MEFWSRFSIVAAVIVVTAIVAKLVDARMAKRELDPVAATRYRVLRRSVVAAIVVVGILSALLAIPPVRAVAGAVLGSAAVIGLVVGLAAQSTLANFIAGILIAFTQPVRIGDTVEVDGAAGVVEEIGLSYTFIRLSDRTRLVIPNAKLAADTIRNASIVSREKVAEVTVQVPIGQELSAVVGLIEREVEGEREPQVYVSALDGSATVTVRARAADPAEAERLERELRLRVHERLRAEGMLA